ncbi:MAG: hypothetical protein ACLFPD_05725 [Desulfosudaceae bacterium]
MNKLSLFLTKTVRTGGNPFSARAKTGLICVVPALMMVGLCGCRADLSRPEPVPPDLSEDAIAGQIRELEENLPAQSGVTRATTLARLARLYSHPNNPAPDLDQAVACLEAYGELPGTPTVDAVFPLELLRQLSRCRSQQRTSDGDITALNRKLEQLESRCRQLEAANQAKAEIIEKLKYLDIRLENRRGAFD